MAVRALEGCLVHVTVSARNGRRTAVMAWLDAGGNINQWWEDQPDADSVGRTPERDGRTLLMIASSFGHSEKLVDSPVGARAYPLQ